MSGDVYEYLDDFNIGEYIKENHRPPWGYILLPHTSPSPEPSGIRCFPLQDALPTLAYFYGDLHYVSVERADYGLLACRLQSYSNGGLVLEVLLRGYEDLGRFYGEFETDGTYRGGEKSYKKGIVRNNIVSGNR